MSAMSATDFAFCDNIARQAAYSYHRNWQWANLDDLIQAAWMAIADAWRRADNAETVSGFLHVAARRAVRAELANQRLPVSGRKGHPASTAHLQRDDSASEWLGGGVNVKSSQRLIALANTIESGRADEKAERLQEMRWAKQVVQSAVQRCAPGTNAAVLPAVVVVLTGEMEIEDAAREHGLCSQRLSWAVRRVRAAIKNDAQVLRFVGKGE